MAKVLVIGMGGTGLTAIRETRRLIAERYERGLDAPEVEQVRFLYIDTHEADVSSHRWTVLGKDIRLTEGEKAIITGANLQNMVEHPDQYPDISPWLPTIQQYVGDPGAGAKGIRPYGRLIYEYNENKRLIRDKCTALYNYLNEQFRQDPEWRIYLVCGLSGGTGSGMFIPFAYDLLNWNLHQKGAPSRKFYSFLVLPSLQVVGRHDRYFPNAQAALMELNYYSFQKERLPFDNCYLLEPRNANGLEIGIDNLPLVIAQRVFLNIQGGEAASFADAMMDNPNLGQSEGDIETGRRHSLNFSTFGLAVVSYPREVIAQCLTLKLSGMVVTNWLILKQKSPTNTNERTRQELASIRLSWSHVAGDADPFGRNTYDDYLVQIENLVYTSLRDIPKKMIGSNVDRIRQEIEDGFRDVGIEKYYQQLENDLDGAILEVLKFLRSKLTTFLRSEDLGVDFAKKFLEELAKILEEHRKSANKLADNDKTATFRRNLSTAVNTIRAKEQKWFYGGVEDDRINASTQLKAYLQGLANVRAGRYGLLFINRVSPIVTSLAGSLEKWISKMTESNQKLAGKLETVLKELEKGSKENGKSIFNTASLDQMISATSLSVVQRSIEEAICQEFNQSELDLFSLTETTNLNPEDIINDLTYKWVLSDACPINVKQITLYDKFVDEIRTPQARQQILTEASSLSAPFLKFAPTEVGKKAIASTEAKITTIPESEGRMSRDGRPTQTVIRDDLLAVGVPSNAIRVASDQERIIFLQEKQVFPLRFIESLSLPNGLRDSYDRFSEKRALHIDKRIESNLYDLFMLSPEEKAKILESEEVFLIARAKGWIFEKVNQYTMTTEIRYEFEDVVTVGKQKLVLGNNFEMASLAFSKNVLSSVRVDADVSESRQRLTDCAKSLLRSLKSDEVASAEFRNLLKVYLDAREQECAAGSDDPRYEKDKGVVNRILRGMGK
jgi:hypothetical protein